MSRPRTVAKEVRVLQVGRALTVGLALAALAGCSQESRLKTRCLGGDVPSCTQLGDAYAAGRGVERNAARAAEMYERSCAGGVADICNALGEIYEQSDFEGGPARAAEYYARACEGHSSAGCLNLGLYYSAREEKARALSLFEQSCGGGWAPGCHQLGVTYAEGDGVPKDMAKAIAYYTQACDMEHIDSCLSIGNYYAAGDPATPTRDVAAAIRLYGKALKLYNDGCEAGEENSCTERDRIRTRMAVLSAEPQAPAQLPNASPTVIKN